MPRYFLEVSYNGAAYSGFQVQQNANTIQAEIEKAIKTLSGSVIVLTGSSRTDAGVHAKQNYFHFDSEPGITAWRGIKNNKQFLYKINAILPSDICALSVQKMPNDAHSRFDATSRLYRYYIHQTKDPFLRDRAYYFPYKLDIRIMEETASLIKNYKNFSAFSKKNTQVKSFECSIFESKWVIGSDIITYEVRANRFLRGMVRALVATQLKAGRGKITINDFKSILKNCDSSAAFFSAPAHGLFLESVEYPVHIFSTKED